MSLRRSKRLALKDAGNTNKSEKAQSTSSSRRVLEARATRELAELRQKEIAAEAEFKRKEIEAEKALVQARLEEELASLRSRSSVRSQSEKATEQWVESTRPYCGVPVHEIEKENFDNPVHCEKHDKPRDPVVRDSVPVNSQNHQCIRDNNDLSFLSSSIAKALTLTHTNNDKLLGRLTSTNLPTFSGDSLEWLRFKNAYEMTTRVGHYSEEENLARLQRCLQGEAWEAVAARLIATTSASDVMRILEMRFGRPDLVLGRLIADMRKVPKLTGMHSEVVLLATKVDNCVAAIQSAGNLGYLYSPELINEILRKLTEPLFFRWLDYSKGMSTHQPQLSVLAKYLMSEAQEICRRGVIEPPKIKVSSKPRTLLTTTEVEEESPGDSAFLTCDETAHEMTNAVSSSKQGDTNCIFCSDTSHTIKTCPKFKSEPIDQRWEWIVKHRLCFRCLSTTHRRDRCKSKKRCSKCNMTGHHTLLHKEMNKKDDTSVEKVNCETSANIWSDKKKKVYLKVIPVDIDGPTGSVSTYALLDEGSTLTLVEKDIADQVGAVGPTAGLNLQGAIGGGKDISSQVVTLTVRTSEGAHRIDKVRTVDSLTLPSYAITEDELTFEHLKGIPLHAFAGKPSLLIGQDNWHLIVSREIREGRKNEPVASRTLLGWVLHGFSSSLTEKSFGLSCHVRQRDDELHNLVNDYFRLDSIGIKYEDKKRYSPDERRALDILDAKSNLLENRWETGLLWRSDDVVFPNNRRNAEHRLRIVEKMMDADPSFATDYSKQVQNMLDKSYAEEVTESDTLTGKVWFLPHFGVRNPNKPGKLRLVHDAKAETRGVSLNTELLSGPDLLNSLIGVLLRFRERAVALTGDIREMFMQVKIIRQDQNAQCFLWRGMARDIPSRVYRMTSMIFGAKSSPCTATYILRRNAERFAATHPRAVEAINKRHYVDDYLDSVDTEEEAQRLVQDIIMIHKAGGFDIRGWASNTSSVLPPEEDKPTVSLLNQDHVERTLGVNWKPACDTLGFDLSLKKIDRQVLECTRKPTKREILKVVMSVFDPLGFLGPFMIRGKILLQKLWQSGKGWDHPIDDSLSQTWFCWLHELKTLQGFVIPRCYGLIDFDKLQLHVFVDASEEAYACVAYLRSNERVVFVAGKSRVAPLKCATIPRLELQAALLGARLGQTIEKEHSFSIDKRHFWTDSKTVWYWINKKPKKEKVFVSNRLAEIDELTKSCEWRWLPGTLNVADEATRAKDNSKSRWLSGPEFLRLPEENWPLMEPEPDEDNQIAMPITESITTKLINEERFSNWRRLVRSLTYAILFIHKFFLKKNIALFITPDYENMSERLILKQGQADMFADDISLLKKGKQLKPSSKLIHLNPVFDSEGLLVAKSRLESSRDLPLSLKRPIILDAKHRVTRLLIEHYHKRLGHNSTETLINELRQRFYILRLRNTVKNMIHMCVICKKKRGRPVQPMMGALPENRTEHHCRPFTYCGIDLFGPMTVTVGRRNEKRWGVIFTCFSTRAVHIELASSLSTDSTILAIRRMSARRGFPTQIHSDNGTNFRSADKELKRAVQEVLTDCKTIQGVNNLGIKWTFNPPDAPHMGGVWERLVRSIKTALSSTLLTLSPKEEVLLTLLIEAENIVNCRPLTHVSLELDDEEALTPNHFLIGASNPLPRLGVFTDADLDLRKQWRIAQRLCDKFWARWLREYIPCLQVRNRWTSDAGGQVKLGDLVLIADPTSPRNIWPRGKVVGVIPGRDGRVRMVDVLTKGGVLRRPVNRLVLLVSLSPH